MRQKLNHTFDMIKSLFSNLYLRFNRENDLSDFTWAFCKTSQLFQELFLSFFFQHVVFDNISSFNRELSKEDSRADFVIENNGVTYVIECKINDRNHHFHQYINAYKIPNKNLGYIVNYNHREEGFEVKTWKEFFEFIEAHIPIDEEKVLFEGYLEYLKNVCGIIKIKKMELSGIHSLYNFNIVLKSVINRTTDKFSLSYYNTDFKESYYGYKFQVSSSCKKDIWLSLGLWFHLEKPVVTLGVWKREGWGKPLCDIIEEGEKHIQDYAAQSYLEDSSYFFEGTDKFYIEFSNASTPEQQKEILCSFVDEVVNFYIDA